MNYYDLEPQRLGFIPRTDGWIGQLVKGAGFKNPGRPRFGLVVEAFDFLCEHHYLRRGELVGDLFAGTGSIGIVAAHNGYRYVGQELERKWTLTAALNFRRHIPGWTERGVPTPIIKVGDSTTKPLFSDRMVDAIVSAPPNIRMSDDGKSEGFSNHGEPERQGRAKATSLAGHGDTPGQLHPDDCAVHRVGTSFWDASWIVPECRDRQRDLTKSRHYWELACMSVERCYDVLKPGGVAALFLCDYIKGGRLAGFPAQWAALMESRRLVLFHRAYVPLVQETTDPTVLWGDKIVTRKRHTSFANNRARQRGYKTCEHHELLYFKKE